MGVGVGLGLGEGVAGYPARFSCCTTWRSRLVVARVGIQAARILPSMYLSSRHSKVARWGLFFRSIRAVGGVCQRFQRRAWASFSRPPELGR